MSWQMYLMNLTKVNGLNNTQIQGNKCIPFIFIENIILIRLSEIKLK